MTEAAKSSARNKILFAALAALVVVAVWWTTRAAKGEGSAGDEAGDEVSELDPSELARSTSAQTDSGKLLRGANKATVSGTVLDTEGQPIAGATVCARPVKRELLGIDEGQPRCATSEGDGHFRLEGLWPVNNVISASAPQFQPANWVERVDGRDRSELALAPGQERTGVEIVLERGGVPIRGVVKDISGGVIEGALVSSGSGWWFANAAVASTRTDAEGRFELWAKPGRNSLRARAEGYARARTQTHAPTDLAEIFLTPESAISGVVVHAETGETIAGVTVQAGEAGYFGRGEGSAQSDEEGRFRISGLSPGIYDLTAAADEFYGEGVEQVHLGLAQSVEGLVVEVHPAFSVSGTVVIAETGEPCRDASVSLHGDNDLQRGARADADGEILIRGALPGEYEVEVGCRDYVPEPSYGKILIEAESLSGLEWTVHAGLAIRGVVVDSAGNNLEDISVSARAKSTPDADPRGQRTSSWGAKTEEDGSFELRGLIAGDYELNIYSPDYPRLPEPQLVELGESADVEGVRLVVPATGRLVGVVRDARAQPVSGVTVHARALSGRWNNAETTTNDEGRFVFEHLLVGETRVTARIGWFQGMRAPGTTDDDIQGELVMIEAESEAHVELVVESNSQTIRGVVVDSSGAPVGDAFVDATRMSDSAAAGAGRGRWQARWGWDKQPVLSEPDGSFEIDELAEGGQYLVRAYRKGGGEAVLEGVAAGSSGIELTIVDTGEIAGVVVISGGGFAERFSIQAVEHTKAVWRDDSFFRTKGAFALHELPPGKYEMTVSAPEGSAKTEVTFAAGEVVRDLKIELTPKVDVFGRLVDVKTREPVPGMKVNINPAGAMIAFTNEDRGEHKDISDADGRFELEDVPTGKVRAWIHPRDFSDDAEYSWTNRVMTLPAEPERQDLGEIELMASRLDRGEQPGDLGFKIKDPPPNSEPEDRIFEVAVIRPGGPADGTGLELGDRILSVDGQTVTGLDFHRYGTLTRAPPGTVIELGIEGGKRVQIELGPPVD